jgi:hypothetical protein
LFKWFISFSIGQNSSKNYLDQKLMKCVSFQPQKLTHNVSFLGQKPVDPFSQITISGARNRENGSELFLAPETDVMGERNFMRFAMNQPCVQCEGWTSALIKKKQKKTTQQTK